MADKPKEEEVKPEAVKDEKSEATEGAQVVEPEKSEEKREDAEPEPNKELEEVKSELALLRSKMEAITKADKDAKNEAAKEEPAPAADDKEGTKKDMAIDLTKQKKEDEETRDFADFLRTGEIKRDVAGFDSAAGEAVLPTEVLDVLKQPKDPSQLSGYVNKVQVTAPTGKLPILKKATARLASAEELAENPAIANATIDKVNYDVVTLRGQLPISMEMSQDYPSIKSLLAEYVGDVKNQTEQYKIGEVLKTATPVAATTIDDIKDAYNKGLTNYGADRMFVISESLYAELDKAKDNDGRYLLQDSIASATGKTLLGAVVVIVPDEVLGAAGDMVAFVGSLKAFVLEAIRANVTLQWVRNEQFEQVLGVAFRADFKPADTAAGKFITYTPAPKA